jgi:hypothetical protein
MDSKKWLTTWFIIILIIPVVGAFNYKIDSLGLVNSNGYLSRAAKDLANGNMIAGLKNFDERIFRKKVIENIKDDIEWVVIGSSRSIMLRKRTFLNSSKIFYNYSVSGASLEDFIALTSIHIDNQHKLPKNIIFGVDPWIFNKNNGQNRYLSFASDYNKLRSKISNNQAISTLTIKENTQYINKLFSIEYLIENIKFVKNNLNNNLKGYSIVDTINVDTSIREPDGSLQYPYKNRNPDFEKVKNDAIAYSKGNVYSLNNFTKLDNIELFESFILYLKNNGVNVILYLPPYNPISYDLLSNNKKYMMINETEKYLLKFSNKNDIKIVGSYNPHKYNFTYKDFFDGMHGLDNTYNVIFKEISQIK